jgi:ABC-type uncharacterized transport systems, ATPase components
LLSSDIDEILELSDRIVVLHEGMIAGIVTNGPGITKAKLGAMMMGLGRSDGEPCAQPEKLND